MPARSSPAPSGSVTLCAGIGERHQLGCDQLLAGQRGTGLHGDPYPPDLPQGVADRAAAGRTGGGRRPASPNRIRRSRTRCPRPGWCPGSGRSTSWNRRRNRGGGGSRRSDGWTAGQEHCRKHARAHGAAHACGSHSVTNHIVAIPHQHRQKNPVRVSKLSICHWATSRHPAACIPDVCSASQKLKGKERHAAGV